VHPDVIISGAGIIGLSLALELQERGATVMVLDRGEPGGESSSAAAGMLAPSDPETPVKLRPLAEKSASLYPEFIRKIEQCSQMEADFRQGTIVLLDSETSSAPIPPDHLSLTGNELQQLEPTLSPRGHAPFVIAKENSVDPDRLMRAIIAACMKRGIALHAPTTVMSFREVSEGIEVVTERSKFLTPAAVNCQGAWAGVPVRPRKGQMLYLQPSRPVLNHVLRAPDVYLVPRSSGQILVGATVEDVGYDKAVNPAMIEQLHRAASNYVPELASAALVKSWAGLRPGTPDDLPILGETDTRNIFIAAGHFRNGILLAPATARVMADLIAGKTPEIDLRSFSAGRFTTAQASD
jgi:glycine oxidase